MTKGRQGWLGIGASVRGAAHARSDLPNQDAIAWTPDERVETPWLIVGVADGHGSPSCFRSEHGSALAVTTAIDVLRAFMTEHADCDPDELVEAALEMLPRRVEERWKAAVLAELERRPFEADELDHLERERGPGARAGVEANPYLAFGTTLLLTGVAERYRLYFQLGDGDIVAVSASGEARQPLPPDARLIANETTSLCQPEAWRDVRLRLDFGEPPALVLVSTDGYSNSFGGGDDFLKVGSDLLAMLKEHGAGPVAEHLPGWLAETTESGSGDDISVGLLYRMASEASAQPDSAPAASEVVTDGIA